MQTYKGDTESTHLPAPFSQIPCVPGGAGQLALALASTFTVPCLRQVQAVSISYTHSPGGGRHVIVQATLMQPQTQSQPFTEVNFRFKILYRKETMTVDLYSLGKKPERPLTYLYFIKKPLVWQSICVLTSDSPLHPLLEISPSSFLAPRYWFYQLLSCHLWEAATDWVSLRGSHHV